MPFKKPQKSLAAICGGQIFLSEIVQKKKKTKSGEVVELVVERVSQSKELPDPRAFELDTVLKASTPVKPVGTAVIDAQSYSIPELGDAPDDDQDEKKDVTPDDKKGE